MRLQLHGPHEPTVRQPDAAARGSPWRWLAIPLVSTRTERMPQLFNSIPNGSRRPVPTGIFRRRRWGRSRPTRSGCTTRWATCGSGRWTAGTNAIREHLRTAALGSPATVRIACHGVAVGSTLPGGSARPVAAAILRWTIGTVLPASAWSESSIERMGCRTRILLERAGVAVMEVNNEATAGSGRTSSSATRSSASSARSWGCHSQVWPEWPEPGNDQFVIVSYTGVIRQGLTVDPGDPRTPRMSENDVLGAR